METREANKLELKKDFPVSKSRLYQAWTNPEELKKWWKPMGNSLREATNNVKENGSFYYAFAETENTPSIIITGEYLEVKREAKLVYTWNWKMPQTEGNHERFRLTITFQESEKGSSLSILQEELSEGETITPRKKGWENALDNLYHYLSDSGNGESNNASGYQEVEEQQKIGQ